jgi:hypothetical protein
MKSLFTLIATTSLLLCGSVNAAVDELLYVLDIVNHGSALPTNFLNATGGQNTNTGPG